MLQPRFTRRTRKRTFRLLEHPRFRAAYDFLLLRAGESEQMRELGEWWTQAQELPPERLAAELGSKPADKADHTDNVDNEAPSSAAAIRRGKRRGGRRHRRKSPAADK